MKRIWFVTAQCAAAPTAVVIFSRDSGRALAGPTAEGQFPVSTSSSAARFLSFSIQHRPRPLVARTAVAHKCAEAGTLLGATRLTLPAGERDAMPHGRAGKKSERR